MIPTKKQVSHDTQLQKGEEVRPIDGEDGYFVSNYGNVFSTYNGYLKKLTPFIDGGGNYYNIGIRGKKYILHRLVAKAFIPNPNNLPEVNHKDKNKLNPRADNLEWCTRKENLQNSYSTMSPVRNYSICKLYNSNELIGEFQSISKACRFAKKHFNASESSLCKYLKWKDLVIVPDNKTGRYTYENHPCKRSNNKAPIRIYKNGYFVKEVKTFNEAADFFCNIGQKITADGMKNRYLRGTIVDGYSIKRN